MASVKLPTLYQEMIHLSRYARWMDEAKRRETWDETVGRYLDYMCDVQCKGKISKEVKDELRRGILGLDVMPSMRCMMTAGKALDTDNVAGFNPVTGDTRVVTRERGNVAIRELYESGENVTVLNKDGIWTSASFAAYGKQEVWEVTFRLNSNTRKVVRTSGNHRWVLCDGKVVATSDLMGGERVGFQSAVRPPCDDEDYVLGVRHGIVYGDGSATYSCKRVKGYHVRLCGKSSELLKYFDGYPVSYPPVAGGDPIVMMYDGFAKTHALKELPSPIETESYLVGFIRGWMAADGSVSKSSQVSLCTAQEGVDWLRNNAEKLGFVIQRVQKQNSETNLGKRRQDSFVVFFSRSSLMDDDFLCSWKKEQFRGLESHWVVEMVRRLDYQDDVYCAEVPETNTFVLEGGLITGNCAYVAVDDIAAFSEILYILMCGTGCGYSVERQFINNLPAVADRMHPSRTVIKVDDSRLGWADAYRELVSMLYQGRIPEWDVSEVRPAGARLKTFGGRASGPEPLVDLFRFTIETFKAAMGRKLNSIECHDICCKIGEVVVSGGVRRSALISLSNPSDDRMRYAKSGNWAEVTPWRAMANNSACYTEKPGMDVFMREWLSLYESKSGERGIFNREAAKKLAERYGRRDPNHPFGCNPCSEIVLRSCQFCNLTEVVVRPGDVLKELKRKVEMATILGTMQATLTNFRYLRPIWKKNTEEERLLGVSMTGIMDNELTSGRQGKTQLKELLEALREHAVKVNKEWAAKLGISPAAAITCVKPSGTVSQLVDCSSGIHARFAGFYVRRVRADKKDPMAQMMMASGFPHETDLYKPEHQVVFSFPQKVPASAITADTIGAIDQLELWKMYQAHWCEHKPSCTVYVRETEWMDVGAWVYRNFDAVSGIAFLPHSGHTYKQAPYQELSEDEYNKMVAAMPKTVDWSKMKEYEVDDSAVSVNREMACTGDKCEVVGLDMKNGV